MSDFALEWDADLGAADLAVSAGDLRTTEDLRPAVLLSLYTDRRAEVGDAVEGSDRRGWWADEFGEAPLGSRLWLLDRGKRLPSTLARAEEYAREALAWLVTVGVAESVTVTAGWLPGAQSGYYLDVAIARPQRDPARYRFDGFWGS